MTSSSPVNANDATMGYSVESGRLLISAFMYCLESEWGGPIFYSISWGFNSI